MPPILMVARHHCGAILSVSIIKQFTTSWYLEDTHPKAKKKAVHEKKSMLKMCLFDIDLHTSS